MAARQIEGGVAQEDVANGRRGFRDEVSIVKRGGRGGGCEGQRLAALIQSM